MSPASHSRARSSVLCVSLSSALYCQCAAMPRSATFSMPSVRICTSSGKPFGPNNVVCSD